jgi:hypothetical protein
MINYNLPQLTHHWFKPTLREIPFSKREELFSKTVIPNLSMGKVGNEFFYLLS